MNTSLYVIFTKLTETQKLVTFEKRKMGKAKALKHNADKGKQQLHEIKGGSIKKNKDSKLKNTSKGKITSVTNSKEILRKPFPVSFPNKSSDQKHTPNKRKILKKRSSPVAKQSKQDSSNKKQNLKRSTNSSKAQKIGKKIFNSRKTEKQLDKSNSNITESEDYSLFESDESDSDIPNIFDKSLAESDDDDEDYEEREEDMDDDDDSDEKETVDDDDDSDEEGMSERKGVKKFNGLQSKTETNKKIQTKDDDSIYDESTTENTSDRDTDEDKGKKKKDNFEHFEKPKFKVKRKGIKNSLQSKTETNKKIQTKDYDTYDESTTENTSDQDTDEDKDCYNTSDDGNNEDAELGTKALLGKSIADDDDDEDFNAENEDSYDEDDISSEEDSENVNTIKKDDCIIVGNYNITKTERDNLARRILLIDNIPKPTPSYEIAEMCAEFGEYEIFEARPYPAFFIDSVPESIEPMDWLNRYYPNLETFSVNVLYKTRHEALNAMKHMNGMKFARHYLNVITADLIEQEPDHAVYVTNLRKTMPENYLWEMFKQCGKIVRVRNVRDPFSGLNKGFGYIAFNNEAAATYALKLHGVKLNGRRMTVLPYPYRENACHVSFTEDIKRKNDGIKRILSLREKYDEQKKSKLFKKNSGKPAARNVEPERTAVKYKYQAEDEKRYLPSPGEGQMVGLKNKKEKNKLDKKRKKITGKKTALNKEAVTAIRKMKRY